MAFLSATFVICERALREADGVISAIRIVDYFMVGPGAERIPPEERAVLITVVGNIRVTANDQGNHNIVMTLIRPDGEASPSVLANDQPIPMGQIPDVPRVVWIIAQVGVVPKQFGTHQFVISFDGIDVARMQFILAEYSAKSPFLNVSHPAVTAS